MRKPGREHANSFPVGRIWLSPPAATGDEMVFLRAALESGWTAGPDPQVEELESALSEVLQVPNVLALASGTAALHLALRTIGVKAGEPVICSTLTYVASASPILYERAEPVFVDSEPESWNLDPVRLVEAIEALAAHGRKPAAVICVDLFGQCANYSEIEEICRRYEVPLIEDAAEALGASHHRRAAGSFGDAAVVSFNANKIVTATGGGARVSFDPALIEQIDQAFAEEHGELHDVASVFAFLRVLRFFFSPGFGPSYNSSKPWTMAIERSFLQTSFTRSGQMVYAMCDQS